MSVARCMATRDFLIRFSNGHAKQKDRQLKKFRDYFQQNTSPLTKKIHKFESSHYRNVSMPTLGTRCGSLGISRGQFGNHWPSRDTGSAIPKILQLLAGLVEDISGNNMKISLASPPTSNFALTMHIGYQHDVI